jgi:hypothetical protein
LLTRIYIYTHTHTIKRDNKVGRAEPQEREREERVKRKFELPGGRISFENVGGSLGPT